MSKDVKGEGDLAHAIEGGAVSRRWLLKSTANLAAGGIAVTALGSAQAETKPAAEAVKASTAHDPHAPRVTEYTTAQFEGWESV
jgi:hypothetical protein